MCELILPKSAVMEILVVLALVAITFSASFEKVPAQRVSGENGWYIPQFNGSLEWTSLEEAQRLMTKNHAYGNNYDSKVVRFYLNTKSNPKITQQIYASDDIIKNSNFDRKNPTLFVIHGWKGSWRDEMISLVRDAWLSKGAFNIISVDWSTRSINNDYASSKQSVPDIGRLVAKFIDYLKMSHGMPFVTLTVTGFDLGAHVAGFAGKNVKFNKINTIIGLDPSLPLYSYDDPANRLASTDASYVESIQTNGGNLGFLEPIGKAAFYPNGGKAQPGCGESICSHRRAVLYYAEAIRENDFSTVKCSNYWNAVNKNCGKSYDNNVRMSAWTNSHSAAGSYYVPVNRMAPFGNLGKA